MAQYNYRQYTDFKGINLKAGNGSIRFVTPTVVPTSTTGEQLLYVNSSGSLIFDNGTSTTTIGAPGAAPSSTWDGIYAADKTLNVSGTTLTFDGNHASNNVITLQNTGAGTGHLLQITNTGTGKDINGTSDSWSIDKAGVAILEELTIDGTEGSNIFTVTKGDVRFLDGSVAITDDDNAFAFDVTSNTATTGVISTFTANGLTTGGGMLLTSSGTLTTTGYMLTVTANSATSAAGLVRV